MERNKELYETETYECICTSCSKPFISEDENEIRCPKCWEEFMKTHNLNEGIGE